MSFAPYLGLWKYHYGLSQFYRQRSACKLHSMEKSIFYTSSFHLPQKLTFCKDIIIVQLSCSWFSFGCFFSQLLCKSFKTKSEDEATQINFPKVCNALMWTSTKNFGHHLVKRIVSLQLLCRCRRKLSCSKITATSDHHGSFKKHVGALEIYFMWYYHIRHICLSICSTLLLLYFSEILVWSIQRSSCWAINCSIW